MKEHQRYDRSYCSGLNRERRLIRFSFENLDPRSKDPSLEHNDNPKHQPDNVIDEQGKRRKRERLAWNERKDRADERREEEFDQKLRLMEVQSWVDVPGMPKLEIEAVKARDGAEAYEITLPAHDVPYHLSFREKPDQSKFVNTVLELLERGLHVSPQDVVQIRNGLRLREVRSWLAVQGMPDTKIDLVWIRDGEEAYKIILPGRKSPVQLNFIGLDRGKFTNAIMEMLESPGGVSPEQARVLRSELRLAQIRSWLTSPEMQNVIVERASSSDASVVESLSIRLKDDDRALGQLNYFEPAEGDEFVDSIRRLFVGRDN